MEALIFIGVYLTGLVFTAIVCGVGYKHGVEGLDHPMWAVFWPFSWCMFFIPAMVIVFIDIIIAKVSGKRIM